MYVQLNICPRIDKADFIYIVGIRYQVSKIVASYISHCKSLLINTVELKRVMLLVYPKQENPITRQYNEVKFKYQTFILTTDAIR